VHLIDDSWVLPRFFSLEGRNRRMYCALDGMDEEVYGLVTAKCK
jgi:hypothetical protein